MDNATSLQEAEEYTKMLGIFLDVSYGVRTARSASFDLSSCLKSIPEASRLALEYLPTTYLSSTPLYDLLRGFEIDLDFTSGKFPIRDREVLAKYGERVAGTVAELIIELAYCHSTVKPKEKVKSDALEAGRIMGVALQVVNVARDIAVDAKIGRVYIPTTWLKEADLTPEDVIKDPQSTEMEALRLRLLNYALDLYQQAMPQIEALPSEARRPMRVAVESYMEIGRVLREPGYRVKAGRATVPKLRRIRVAWKALCT